MIEIEIPPIEKSIPDIDEPFPSVIERYYTKYRYTDAKDGHDQLVMLHSNRICLITLAPNHPVIRDQKTISHLNFQVTSKINRLDNSVRGKGKKGGQYLDANAVLTIIECEDGSQYPVRSCVKGKLIEINDNVVKNPQMIVHHPLSKGYVAIILPKLPDGLLELKEKLTLEEDELGMKKKQLDVIDDEI